MGSPSSAVAAGTATSTTAMLITTSSKWNRFRFIGASLSSVSGRLDRRRAAWPQAIYSWIYLRRPRRALCDQRAGEVSRVERAEVFELLPHADQLDREAELVRDRDRDPSPRAAVEL